MPSNVFSKFYCLLWICHRYYFFWAFYTDLSRILRAALSWERIWILLFTVPCYTFEWLIIIAMVRLLLFCFHLYSWHPYTLRTYTRLVKSLTYLTRFHECLPSSWHVCFPSNYRITTSHSTEIAASLLWSIFCMESALFVLSLVEQFIFFCKVMQPTSTLFPVGSFSKPV